MQRALGAQYQHLLIQGGKRRLMGLRK